jgi:hypothetical protein
MNNSMFFSSVALNRRRNKRVHYNFVARNVVLLGSSTLKVIGISWPVLTTALQGLDETSDERLSNSRVPAGIITPAGV